jgi:hypothetical protein
MTLRASLRPAGKGESYVSCEGIEVKAAAPTLAMCRALVAAGYDPAQPLESYRDDVLCLKVRSIGEGARLAIRGDGVGFRFEGGYGLDTAPPIAFAADPHRTAIWSANGPA